MYMHIFTGLNTLDCTRYVYNYVRRTVLKCYNYNKLRPTVFFKNVTLQSMTEIAIVYLCAFGNIISRL